MDQPLPRLIPACAGNTSDGHQAHHRYAVHPRVCGEHSCVSGSITSIGGSSPRVPGTQDRQEAAHVVERFIPACAGNTPSACRRRAGSAVHPRVCGEHQPPSVIKPAACGSSPRVRGTPVYPLKVAYPQRFIPACAGNTNAEPCKGLLQAVHPRVCGEHMKRSI